MGTRERRQREIAEREQRFLDKAQELIRANGLLNLQMSHIAEGCDYATGTLYQHFSSKEDLLLALATADARTHVDLFRRAADWQASPRERMFAIGVADMILVQRNPDYYRLAQYALCDVVWHAASLARREEFLEVSRPIGELVGGIVADAVAGGDLELHGCTGMELAVGLWSLSTGMHSLVHSEGMLDHAGMADPYRVMCRHMQHLLNGFGWRPLADMADPRATDALIQRICDEVFHGLACQKN